MTELNGCKPRPVTVLGPFTFSIGDTSGLSEYVRGGIATQVKMPKTVAFVSMIYILYASWVLREQAPSSGNMCGIVCSKNSSLLSAQIQQDFNHSSIRSFPTLAWWREGGTGQFLAD